MKKLVSFLAIIALLVMSFSACGFIDSILDDTSTSSPESSNEQESNTVIDSLTTSNSDETAAELIGNEKFEYVIQKNFKDCKCETAYIESANIVNYTVQYDSLFSLKYDVRSMQLSIYETLNDLSDSKGTSVTFKVLFPVTDDYGNTSYSKVLFARYSSDTLAKINWDNFFFDKVDNIADTFEIDSQLKQYIQ